MEVHEGRPAPGARECLSSDLIRCKYMVPNTKTVPCIYALCDPRTSEVRYVGMTTLEPIKRFRAHLSPAELRKRNHKVSWVKSLLSEGLTPYLKVLEVVDSPDLLRKKEMYWVEKLKSEGAKLTNLTLGGEGGINPLPEVRENISKALRGRALSAEHRKALSDALKGKKRMPFTEEHLQNMVVAQTRRREKERTERGVVLSHRGLDYTRKKPFRRRKTADSD